MLIYVQLVDQNIRIRVAVHGLHCGVDIILREHNQSFFAYFARSSFTTC